MSSEFYLFAALARALSHSIRGDLAVITNDLSYLATVHPGEDIERSRGRCARIGETLSKLSVLRDHELEQELVPLGEVFALNRAEMVGDVPEQISLWLDRARFSLACATIRELVEKVGNAAMNSWIPMSLRTKAEQPITLEFHCGDVTDEVTKSSSVTEWASSQFGERFVVDAVVADLILRAHGCEVECCTSSTGALIRISFVGEVQP